MYKTYDFTEQSDDDYNNIYEMEAHENLMFKNMEPCSDEIATKELINNIINSIEAEEELSLKTANMPQNGSNIRPSHTDYSIKINKRKRKIDQINENVYSKKMEEGPKKIFDPINEHCNWCPWIKTEERDSNDNKKQLLNICQIYYKKLNKILQSSDVKKSTNSNSFTESKNENSKDLNYSNDNKFNSEILFEKVRAAQSLLINSTSKLSFKNN